MWRSRQAADKLFTGTSVACKIGRGSWEQGDSHAAKNQTMPVETRPKSLREELISRAKLGEITPESAESEAMLFDCGPLKLSPESLDFDPQTEAQWTLLMALVWIIERDLTAVRAVWNRARRNATEWIGSPLGAIGTEHKKSWELKPLDPPTVGDVDAVVDEEAGFMLRPFIVPGLDARGELWANLQSGRLPAEGKPCGPSPSTTASMSCGSSPLISNAINSIRSTPLAGGLGNCSSQAGR
jgi:hypothetical protein